MKYFRHKYISIFIFYFLQIEIILTQKKNLIIGSIKNYEWNTIKLFFISFQYAKIRNCDIVMFVNNLTQSTITKIKTYGVIIHEIPQEFKNMRINNYRYKFYADFLSNKLDKYNIIFVTDVKDVIFQKDVFKYYEKFKKFLGLAIEDGIISESINQKWMISAFGNNMYKKLKNKPIICSGTIWGTSEIIYNFCKIIWKKISSSNIPIPFNERHDQTIVNYIIYHSKMFRDYIIQSTNKDGPIMTIALTLKNKIIYLDSEKNILNRKGEVAAVIHQYNREKELIKILTKKYNLTNIKNNELSKKNKIIICLFILVFILYIKKSNKIKKINSLKLISFDSKLSKYKEHDKSSLKTISS